ncbi:MAG: oligogalacturonate lyase family protein [Planctomycetaceae bacterium]
MVEQTGQVEWPPEWEHAVDPQTGARITCLTSGNAIDHPLYYLTNSFSTDCTSLVFASDRRGQTDLYRVSLTDGGIRRLTDLPGLQPFSGNVVDDRVYFTTDGAMHQLDLSTGNFRTLFAEPGCQLGEVTINADGQWAAALITRGTSTGILVTQIDSSQTHVILQDVRALYHPQFHPVDPQQLIYSADPPDPRMWAVRIDGSHDRCIYRNHPEAWFVHETFLGRSDRLIVVHWHHGLFELDLKQGQPRQITDLNVWHIAARHDGRMIVCDTHLPDVGLCLIDPQSGAHLPLCRSGASNLGRQWHQPTPLSADHDAPGWATMVENEAGETDYGPQWTHPHPSFSPDGKWVTFTSDVSGSPQVYVVEVPADDWLNPSP